MFKIMGFVEPQRSKQIKLKTTSTSDSRFMGSSSGIFIGRTIVGLAPRFNTPPFTPCEGRISQALSVPYTLRTCFVRGKVIKFY